MVSEIGGCHVFGSEQESCSYKGNGIPKEGAPPSEGQEQRPQQRLPACSRSLPPAYLQVEFQKADGGEVDRDFSPTEVWIPTRSCVSQVVSRCVLHQLQHARVPGIARQSMQTSQRRGQAGAGELRKTRLRGATTLCQLFFEALIGAPIHDDRLPSTRCCEERVPAFHVPEKSFPVKQVATKSCSRVAPGILHTTRSVQGRMYDRDRLCLFPANGFAGRLGMSLPSQSCPSLRRPHLYRLPRYLFRPF